MWINVGLQVASVWFVIKKIVVCRRPEAAKITVTDSVKGTFKVTIQAHSLNSFIYWWSDPSHNNWCPNTDVSQRLLYCSLKLSIKLLTFLMSYYLSLKYRYSKLLHINVEIPCTVKKSSQTELWILWLKKSCLSSNVSKSCLILHVDAKIYWAKVVKVLLRVGVLYLHDSFVIWEYFLFTCRTASHCSFLYTLLNCWFPFIVSKQHP